MTVCGTVLRARISARRTSLRTVGGMQSSRRRASTAARAVTGGAGAGVCWAVLGGPWRSAEAALVAHAASLGPGSVEWAGGDQLWVSGAVDPFVVVVGPWCSALGPVLGAIGVAAAFGRSVRAVRAAAVAAAVLLVGNLIRMITVVVVGAGSGAADLELAHDGWATWWAVGVVLVAVAIVASALRAGEAGAHGGSERDHREGPAAALCDQR